MTSTVDIMLKKLNIKDFDSYKDALEEVIQEIILCGLSRSGFFLKAAFTAGRALSIFNRMEDFLSDMHFSLIEESTDFAPAYYFTSVRTELASCGFTLSIEKSIKTLKNSPTTLDYIFYVSPLEPLVSGIASIEKIQINVVIESKPNPNACFDNHFSLLPSPYSVLVYDMSTLFSSTIYTILKENVGLRLKSLELYKYVWFLARETKINIKYLSSLKIFKIEDIKDLMNNFFNKTDFVDIKQSLMPFIKSHSELALWDKDFFCQITNNLQ